jgi:hypothetical protein
MHLVSGLGRSILLGCAACVWLACTGRIDSVPEGGGGAAASTPEPDEREPAPPAPRADAGGGGGRTGAPSQPDDDGPEAAGPGAEDAGVVASGSTNEEPELFCDAVTLVLLPRCGGGSCHSNPNARIGDFAAGRAEAESFIDVPSVRNASCGFVIDSQDPSQSLLLRKLVGDFPVPTCGGPMPVSGGDLTDEQIECMASWLEQFRAE